MRFAGKTAYSFGAIAAAVCAQSFAAYILFFYIDVVKLPPYLAAIGMLIYSLWSALNDPMLGFISDHTRSSWGRRIPYIACGTAPLAVVYFFLWVPPAGAEVPIGWLFLYFTLFICLFDAFYTMTMLNWQSLYPEMFSSLRERSAVNVLRQTFSILGLGLGVALPPVIFNSLGWGWMGAILGSVTAISWLIALRGSREHLEFSREKQLPLWRSFLATIKNRSFLTFAFANLLVQYSLLTILACVPFFAKYLLDINVSQTSSILLLAFAAALPMLYLWERVAVAAGAKRCFMATMVFMAAALIPLFFIDNLKGAWPAALLVGAALAGFLFAPDLIMADIIDEDEIKTGTRREGIYFGTQAFINRFAIGIEAFSLGIIFTATGYNPYVYTQSREFLAGLRWLIAGFPLIALGLAFVIISFYPLVGRRKMKTLKSELAKIHEQKGVS